MFAIWFAFRLLIAGVLADSYCILVYVRVGYVWLLVFAVGFAVCADALLVFCCGLTWIALVAYCCVAFVFGLNCFCIVCGNVVYCY